MISLPGSGSGSEPEPEPDQRSLRMLLRHDRITQTVVIVIALTSLALFILPPGATSNLVGNITGLTALLLALHFSIRTMRLYGLSMAEGRAWAFFAVGFLLCAIGMISQTVYERTDSATLAYALAIFRTAATPFFVLGFVVKLRFAGIRLETNAKVLTALFTITWIIFAGYLDLRAIFAPGYSMVRTPFPLFSLGEIFILFVIALILQMEVEAKGWLPISVGMFLIVVGDTFYTTMRAYVDAHGGYYDGHPYHLIWYVGLFFVAYGAYYQHRLHSALIAD